MLFRLPAAPRCHSCRLFTTGSAGTAIGATAATDIPTPSHVAAPPRRQQRHSQLIRRRNTVAVATDMISRLRGAGMSPAEIVQMLRTLRHRASTPPATEVDPSLNERVCSILRRGAQDCQLHKLHQSVSNLTETLSVFTDAGVPEPMARDIVHNNPTLLALSKADVEALCSELLASGVDLGDFASILSQHSPHAVVSDNS
ncbi:N-formylglutamate amidohydrolase, putative [Babesia ovata]|uniref:N-formylglutamate amidohydrolase, putative n=1 Tax=Babesia ovata TaxID=189622 RepID=A0A2H6K7L9_9APIC|nr:N-formylglutamate amidohydrolase, putative [Babesia ovata]GBE58993.1 N-formylglutamate amidohydrolase, putative [Babesia ovata]